MREMFADKRKVLIVNRVGYLGGAERVILTFTEHLESRGWQAVLACPPGGSFSQSATAQGLTVEACDFDRMRITSDLRVLAQYPWAWRKAATAINQLCRANRFDIIHVHHPVTALYALSASKRFNVPLVLHVHETLPAKPLYSLAMRFVMHQLSTLLCVSSAAKDLALSMGASPSRVKIVYNGVDRQFIQREQTNIAPPELRSAGPGPHIGVFGVLEPRKAQHIFLEAAAKVAPNFPDARFWLIGSTALKDKQYYGDQLRLLASSAQLRGKVSLVDFKSEIISWVRAMDIVVQPSTAFESFGMSLVEAMAVGRPVIASNVGGMPEVVTHGKTGLVVPAGDPSALAVALADLLSSEDRRRGFGLNGAADVRERFDPDVFQANILNAYDAVLRSQGKLKTAD